MTLRPEFRLGQSEFNEFLWARIGNDETGMPLSVLSALTRLGLDPWREAARLAAMPNDAAITALADMMTRLPETGVPMPALLATPQLLIKLLPSHGSGPLRQVAPGAGPRIARWAAAVVLLAVATILIGIMMTRLSPSADGYRPPDFKFVSPGS